MDSSVFSKAAQEVSFRTLTQKSKVRSDGRGLREHRGFTLKRGMYSQGDSSSRVYGSSQVHIGGTVVAAGVTLMIGQPAESQPDKGDIVCSVVLPPMCSLKYDQQHIRDNQKHEDAYGLESDLNRLLMSGEVVDLSQLCILKGKFAFRLNVNVVCLSHQGNLLDACVACVVSALRDTKLPQPVMDGERLAVSSDASTPLQLVNNTDSLLVPVSIGLFDDEWVVDLAESEETIMRATISCVLLIPADEAMGGTTDSSSNSSNSEPRILHLSQSTASGDMGAEKVSEGLRVCSSVARGLAASLV